MKRFFHLFLIGLMTLIVQGINAEVLYPLFENFENPETDNDWVRSSYMHISDLASPTGSRALYLGQSEDVNSYSLVGTSGSREYCMAYKKFVIPEGISTLTYKFRYRGMGGSSYHRMQICISDTKPVNSYEYPSSRNNLVADDAASTSMKALSGSLSITPGTYYLVVWQRMYLYSSSTSYYFGTPVAIDDIQLYGSSGSQTFTLNDNTIWSDQTKASKTFTSIASWPIPEVDNSHVFVGWNEATDGTGTNYTQLLSQSNFSTFIMGMGENATVYAQTIDLADIEVVEWKKNSVVIKYLGNATYAETKVGKDDVAKGNSNQRIYIGGTFGKSVKNSLADLSTKLDAGLYEIQVDGSDLMQNAGNNLVITFKDENGVAISANHIKIPVIIPSGTSRASDFTFGSRTDVILSNGAIFTLDENVACNSITVGPNAKLVVPTGRKLQLVSSLNLRAGALVNGVYKFQYPQVVCDGAIVTLDLNTNVESDAHINYDYYINNAQYYSLCLPYDVNTADIKYADGTKATFGIQYYDGATRATGASGWKDFEKATDAHVGTLTAGKGYTIYAVPQRVQPLGEARQYQKYAYLRFPMTANLAFAEANKTISDMYCVATSDGVNDNDEGWNLIGNPYLANYSNVAGLTGGTIGLLKDFGEGYEWTGSARYVVIPNENGTSYTSALAQFATLPAFKNFFIQIGNTDAVLMPLVNRSHQGPARIVEIPENNDIETGISLSGNNATDKMGVLIGNYTAAYEINADLQKWANQGLNVYAVSQAAGGNLAFIAIDDATAQQAIKVGYTAPAAGSYTFAFDSEAYDATALEHLYLTDYQLNRTVDLLLGDYNFSTAAGTNDNRFAIACIHRAPGSATDLDATRGNEAYATSEDHELRLHNLPLGADMFIYDVNGRLVESATCTSAYASFALPMGVYQVRVAGENEQVIRAIVR